MDLTTTKLLEENQMSKKLVLRYLGITFGFSYCLWGIVMLLTGVLKIKLDNPLCMIILLLGSCGPSVGSYIAQKKESRINGLKEFIKKAFSFKSSLASYFLVILFIALYFVFPFVTGQIKAGIPVYIAILIIPLMLFGGGMEEPGWRWVLQPELEKIFPLPIAAVFTSVIWSFWHTPLFFIEGSSQAQTNLISFFVLIVGMSFAQAVLYEFSKNVWLSILLHCSFNAFQMAFVVEETILTSIFISLIMIIGAMLIRVIVKNSKYKAS
jgi:membrane protease YdiL (CAAX protease family)